MASFAGLSYAPDDPFPAALDDAVTIYREVLKTTPPENVAIFGDFGWRKPNLDYVAAGPKWRGCPCRPRSPGYADSRSDQDRRNLVHERYGRQRPAHSDGNHPIDPTLLYANG